MDVKSTNRSTLHCDNTQTIPDRQFSQNADYDLSVALSLQQPGEDEAAYSTFSPL